MENKDKFSYTYSAPTEAERREIESIRRQYKPDATAEGGVERLRALHSKVVGRATAISLALGIGGLLISGGGMALVLEFEMFVVGIVLGILGALPMALAYPVYNKVLAQGKAKYGEEIIRLADEILQDK